VIDTGVLGEPTTQADIDRSVWRRRRSSIPELIEAGDKARALVVMADGASRILLRYLERGELAACSRSEARGHRAGDPRHASAAGGRPKLMVSTIASGQNISALTWGPRM